MQCSWRPGCAQPSWLGVRECYYHLKVAQGFITSTRAWSGLEIQGMRLDPTVAARAERFQRDYFAQLLRTPAPTPPPPRVKLGRYDLGNTCRECGDPLPDTMVGETVCWGCRVSRLRRSATLAWTSGVAE